MKIKLRAAICKTKHEKAFQKLKNKINADEQYVFDRPLFELNT